MSSQALRQPFTSEEQQLYSQIFQSLDVEKLGIVTGDKARSTLEKTGLPPTVLGDIWQLSDPTNLGFLNQFSFFVALRLIGHAQAGSKPDKSLIETAGSLPRFAGLQQPQLASPSVPTGNISSPSQASSSLSSLPPLTNHDISKFGQLFAKNAPSGVISGEQARNIFLKAKLPTNSLVQIWNLVDKTNSGQLTKDEFVVAMYLIQNSLNHSIVQLPTTVPSSIWDQVASFQAPISTGNSVGSNPVFNSPNPVAQRPPVARVPSILNDVSNDWVISDQKKQQFNSIFDGLDKESKGVLGPNEVAPFLMTSKLPQDVLATIWDLSDIHNSGEFTRDEFAIAMFLVQKKIAGVELPHVVPDSLLPENHGQQSRQFSSNTTGSAVPQQAPVVKSIPPIPSRDTKPSALDDLVDLNDAFSAPSPVPVDSQTRNISNSSVNYTPARSKAFVPTSSFGQGLAEKDFTGGQDISPPVSASVPAPAPVPVASAPVPAVAPSSTGSFPAAPVQRSTFTAPAPAPSSRSTFAPIIVPTIPLPSFSSGSSRSAGLPANNDLLADSNPEVSGQLSKATTDLANLSNQIGSLTGQTSQLHERRTRAEQELAKITSLKTDIEAKLANLRASYDQEVQKTAEVSELLSSTKLETEELRKEASIAEAQYHENNTNLLNTQKDLEQTQAEHATLKEQLSAWVSQHTDLQAQLEKAQGEIKQSRGFVSINTQQLDVNNIKSQELQQEIERLALSTKELETHHDTLLAKHAEIDEATQSLEQRKLELEQAEAEFQQREQEFAQRLEEQKQARALIDEQDANLQQLVADLQSRKDQLDQAEGQLHQQQYEYAQRIQDFSYKQIQDATSGFSGAAAPVSRDVEVAHESSSSGLGALAAGAAIGAATGLAGTAAVDAVTSSSHVAGDVATTATTATDSEKDSREFSPVDESSTEQGTSFNSEPITAPTVFDSSSSIHNNPPQSVRDDIEDAEQDVIAATSDNKVNEEPVASPADVLAEGYSEQPISDASGAGSFEIVGDHENLESGSTLKQQADDITPTFAKEQTLGSSGELANNLEAAIPGAWSNDAEAETKEITTPVVAAAATLDQLPVQTPEPVASSTAGDDEFPPIKELEIDESDSEAEDEFHETVDEFPSPIKKKVESSNATGIPFGTAAVAAVAAAIPAAVAAPFVSASSLGGGLSKPQAKSVDLDDEFAGLEEATEEPAEAAPVVDEFSGLESAVEDKFADYDEDEFAEQNDFDEELEGNAFFGDDQDQPSVPGPNGEDNEEWEQIFAGFGNQGQAPPYDPSEKHAPIVEKALQHPQPTYHNGEGSSAVQQAPKGRVATTPRSLAVQELTGMGFTKEEALNALEKEKWNLESATNFLLDNA